MAKKDKAAVIPGMAEKWSKIIAKMPDFKESADAADIDGLKKILVESEGNIYTQEQEMSVDVTLNAAKELVKEHSSVYREAIKFQTAKIKYALFLLEGKGVDLDTLTSSDDEK